MSKKGTKEKLTSIFKGTVTANGDIVAGDKIETGDIKDSSNIQIGTRPVPKPGQTGLLSQFVLMAFGADAIAISTDEFERDIQPVAPTTIRVDEETFVIVSQRVWATVEHLMKDINHQRVAKGLGELRITRDIEEVGRVWFAWLMDFADTYTTFDVYDGSHITITLD